LTGKVLSAGAVQRSDQADSRLLQFGGERFQIALRNADIAIVNEHDVVERFLFEVNQCAHFGVRRHRGTDDEADPAIREFGDGAFDDRDGGIIGIADGEEQLEVRIILLGVRADDAVEERVDAANGL
jgi:hypothetical protein